MAFQLRCSGALRAGSLKPSPKPARGPGALGQRSQTHGGIAGLVLCRARSWTRWVLSNPGHPRFSPPLGCGNRVCAVPLRPPPGADGTAPRLRAPEGRPPRPAPPTTASRWRRLQHGQRPGGFSCLGPRAWCERPARRSG